jgi:hypothetical protein
MSGPLFREAMSLAILTASAADHGAYDEVRTSGGSFAPTPSDMRLPAAAATTTTTAATAAVLAWTRFVHVQRTTAHVLTVERGDRLGGVIVTHLHEPKPARALGLAVQRQRA